MRSALDYARPFESEWRAGGALGPEISVRPDADLKTRYLAFFGRRADWTPPEHIDPVTASPARAARARPRAHRG
jgi:hypothetical protein